MVPYILERKEALAASSEKMEIPKSYREIGAGALKNNIKVREIKMPYVRMVGAEAFYNCTALRRAEMNTISGIRKEAFCKCSNLREVILSPRLEELGHSIFSGCKRLEHITCYEECGCIQIPVMTFGGCKNLQEFTVPKHVRTIEERAFYKCESMKHILLPANLKKIETQAFYQCGFEEIELPSGLEFIGESAFLKCKRLEYIKVPESVKVIEKWAFHGCNNLQVVEIAHDPEQIGEWITNKNCKIRCHKGSRTAEYAEKYGIETEWIQEKL